MADVIPSEIELCAGKNIETIPLDFDTGAPIDPELLDITAKTYRLSLKYRKDRQALDYLLSHIMRITESKMGIICIKKYNGDNTIRLESMSIHLEKNIESSGAWQKQLMNISEKKVMFNTSELNGLFGRSIRIEKIIVCDDYLTDTRKKTLPSGHFPIESFCSIPLKYKNSYIGIINISNSCSYTTEKLFKIVPLLSTVSYFLNKASKPYMGVFERSNVEELKDDFLSMISHEIRTPLTGIVGMAQLIPEAGKLNEKQKEYISQQNVCIHQLMELLNDLIDFQTLKARRLKLRIAPFDMKECITTAMSVIKEKAKAKNLKLTVKYQTAIPVRVLGDIQRLRQIIINLLTNAVKFTNAGSIKIRIKATQTSSSDISSKWRISISIEDTGVGIPRREYDEIFCMFRQGDNTKNKIRSKGLGLGLAISRSLAELMGGEINVTSEGIPGRGSIFTVHIPFEEEVEVADIIADNATILKGTQILAVDDKKINRILINEYLFKWGCQPVTVESAEEGLQYLSRDNNFKAIIIDIHMPLMSGIEMAQRIRQLHIRVPLIALSSLPKSSDTNLFDFYLYKPLVEHHLLKCLIECLKRDYTKKETTPPSPRASLSKNISDIKILIADDDASNRYSITELLESTGIAKNNIRVVDNGRSCVSEVSRNFYDVVFMDIKMPEMDGIEATTHIMKLDRSPTIIAISAGVGDVNKEKCQSAGMSGYLVKPITKDDLIRSISGFIS